MLTEVSLKWVLKKREKEKEWGAKKEEESGRRRLSGWSGGEGRKLQAMYFTAYLCLGHDEYRGDIKQIRSGKSEAKWRPGS